MVGWVWPLLWNGCGHDDGVGVPIVVEWGQSLYCSKTMSRDLKSETYVNTISVGCQYAVSSCKLAFCLVSLPLSENNPLRSVQFIVMKPGVHNLQCWG